MRLSSIPSPLFAVLFFLFFSCGRISQRTDPAFPVLSDNLSLEQTCFLISRHAMTVCGGNDTISLKSFFHILDSTAASLGESLADKKPASAGVDSIVNCVYAAWSIGFDPRDTMLETLLPHLVYRNKKGACLGVSLIMLMLAEKLGCPVYGVMLPGHFFCRYESAAVRFNIEPNKAGFRHPDEYYRERYHVAKRPWYDLSNLTKTAVIGVMCYNIGIVCLNHKKYTSAIFYFKEAVRRCNGWPEAAGNLGLAHARSGDLDTAEIILGDLFRQHPDLANCAANYAACAMARKQYEKAAEAYRKGLASFPGDTILLSGLAQAYKRLGQAP